MSFWACTWLSFALFSSVLLSLANADIYLHNPRGSNNRLDEENRDRINDQRLMDTQNNNRGGANVGQMYYYAGSRVPIEWSAQHSCGNPNNFCELVIQIMCDDRLRDGTTTETIPTDPNRCYGFSCDTDVRFGRHESWKSYKSCTYRQRNKGLFTSTQKLQGHSARFTRQNPTGTRFGYECPEERDYYPYWAPTQWRDVAILTNQDSRCAAYKAESQNVKDRWYCDVPDAYFKHAGWWNEGIVPIDQQSCESMSYTNSSGYTWYNVSTWTRVPAWGIPAPACLGNVWSRDNHHGNVEGGYWANWNWTVPSASELNLGANEDSNRCVLRLRYNISTGDIANFDSPTVVTTGTLSSANNGVGNGINGKTGPANVPIWETYGLDNVTGKYRDYVLENNPQVDIFGNLVNPETGSTAPRITLQLAINTAQYGRTFEDRTHRFAIKEPTGELVGKTIHNLNVRGKRGNIVQTYPGTEYDFVPDRLHCAVGDYVHFQWTGSNTNPNNNAGQGREGSDRHNVVVQRGINYPEFGQTAFHSAPYTYGHLGNSYPDSITANFLGLGEVDKTWLAYLHVPGGQFGGEMSELDDAGTYFDLGPRRCNTVGIYHYLCTRNNNFSNRSQKGTIRVGTSSINTAAMSVVGGSYTQSNGLCAGCKVTVAEGSLDAPTTLIIEFMDRATPNSLCSGECASAFMSISSTGAVPSSMTITMPYEKSNTGFASLYKGTSTQGEWEKLSKADCDGTSCSYTVSGTGVYAVKTRVAAEVIVPVVLVVAAGLGIGGYFGYKRWAGYSKKV